MRVRETTTFRKGESPNRKTGVTAGKMFCTWSIPFFNWVGVFDIFRYTGLTGFSNFSICFDNAFVFSNRGVFMVLRIVRRGRYCATVRPCRAVICCHILVARMAVSSRFHV